MIDGSGAPKPPVSGTASARAGWTRLDAAAVRQRLNLAGLDAASREAAPVPTGPRPATFAEVFETVAAGATATPPGDHQAGSSGGGSAAARPSATKGSGDGVSLGPHEAGGEAKQPPLTPASALALYRRIAAMRVRQ